ncbi:MAG TPA: LytTR family transcriptional regulator [Candidatus Blautia intestinigallinarum]|nr:LytTR family transcriptional regulator [Candidatus Blautia intestinigallinarum]
MTKSELERLMELTKKLVHDYYEGDFARWFLHLDSKSVWISQETPILIGDKCIRRYFKKYGKKKGQMLQQEEYQPLPVNSKVAMVIVKLTENQNQGRSHRAVTASFVYKAAGERAKLILYHSSVEEILEEYGASPGRPPMDMYTFRFVKGLLLDQKPGNRISVPSGSRTMFVDLNTVLFIKSSGRKTEFYCLDRIFSCSLPISNIAEKLPEYFYPIHRSYMVNIRYITAIYRYEAELISGVRIPIPALPYMQIKNDLEKMLCDYPRQMSYGSSNRE